VSMTINWASTINTLFPAHTNTTSN